MIDVAIIGTGNIGTDLLLKVLKTDFINPKIFVGRRLDSDGIKIAIKNKISVSDEGINYFINNPKSCQLVFDCTNAKDAIEHSKIFRSQNIKVIDLTPAKVGELCVPSINGNIIKHIDNVNLITCGGQASIPILNIISNFSEELEYIEIVSQISSKSAGMATRINVDNYIQTTETAIKKFTKTRECKVILNLNPAEPCVDMQTTMFIKYKHIEFEKIIEKIYEKIKEIKSYIPYYELIQPPMINDDDILVISVKVKGSGDYLPEYAGNLDIINCAAIELTKRLNNE